MIFTWVGGFFIIPKIKLLANLLWKSYYFMLAICFTDSVKKMNCLCCYHNECNKKLKILYNDSVMCNFFNLLIYFMSIFCIKACTIVLLEITLIAISVIILFCLVTL